MRILVVQLRQLGDILLTTPCVRALRLAWPEAELSFLSHPMGRLILDGNPDVNTLVTYPPAAGWRSELALATSLRRQRFDVVLDFMNNPRSAFYTRWTGAPRRLAFRSARAPAYSETVPKPTGEEYIVRRKARLLAPLGVALTSERLLLPWPAEATGLYRKLLAATPALATAPVRILLSPTHRREPRRWPLAAYAQLADRLTAQWGAAVVWGYGPGEEAVIDQVQALCRLPSYRPPLTTFAEMAALLAQMDLFVGNSNGPSHVAVAVQTPSLQLHGHTSALAWCPNTPLHQALQSPEYGAETAPRIDRISLSAVWAKLEEMQPLILERAASRPRLTVRTHWQDPDSL